MEKTEAELLGVQVTLIGLFLIVFFEGVFPYPLVGLLFGAVGTSIVLTALFPDMWARYLCPCADRFYWLALSPTACEIRTLYFARRFWQLLSKPTGFTKNEPGKP